MKQKQLLLTTTIAMVLTACGTTNEQPTKPKKEDHPLVNQKESRKHFKIAKYFFGNTFSETGSSSISQEFNQKGTFSEAGKTLVTNIWKKLSDKGFSGYDASSLNAQDAYTVTKFLNSKQLHEVPFHSRLVFTILNDIDWTRLKDPAKDIPPLRILPSLFGLQYNGKFVYYAMNGPEKDLGAIGKFPTLALNLFETQPDWNDPQPGTVVSNNLISEWFQVIMGELNADPFFKQFFEAPSAPADASGSTSALSALKGRVGMDSTHFIVNGISGSQVDLGLPMYVQLKGSVDHGKSTNGMTGLIAYKLGNSVLGVVQSYANSGTGFNADSRQLESSVIAAHSFGLMFVEGQFGSVSATDVNFNNWSGVRSHVRLGIDTPFGAPFVQLTHRDFGSTSDTAAYAGLEIATTEFKADTYAFSTSLLTKIGHHSVHETSGSIEWTAALNLNSGIAFNTNLSLGSALESKASLNLSLDR